jgi:hypothetical protein
VVSIVANSNSAIAYAILGIIIGFILAFIVLNYATSLKQPTYATIIIERDESGRIVAIHYIQGGRQGGTDAQKPS